MIVLSGDWLRCLTRKQPCSDVIFRVQDDGDAYTALTDDKAGACTTCPGTLFACDHLQELEVSAIGKQGDRVRVVVAPGGSGVIELGRGSPIVAKGYVLRDGRWEDTPVQLVPLREELYSRTRGLLETNILADAEVFVVGEGSGGSYITWELAKLGIMGFTLMDHDRVEVRNVVRHMARVADVGRYKTKVMADMIWDKNPYARVRTYETGASWDTINLLRKIVRESDLVIVATDNRQSRVILNKLCVEENTPFIIAGAFRRAHGGQVLRVRPGESPCYQCFLNALPKLARDQEVSNPQQAQRLAYSDRPVAVEPGLSMDIATLSLMVVKLATQELLRGKPTTLRSLDEDLVAPLFYWLNRREAGTEFEALEPLEFNVDGMHVLRWYGIAMDRDPACPCCGDFVGRVAAKENLDLSSEDPAFFAPPEAA